MDHRAVTESPEIDIVHVCTPNHLHKDALLSAMQSQKHIYCDKPLVATMAEAEVVRHALADYHGIAQITFQNRFFPATMRARQLIEAGEAVTPSGLTERGVLRHPSELQDPRPRRPAHGGGVLPVKITASPTSRAP